MPLLSVTPWSNPLNELKLVEILQGLFVNEGGGQIGIPSPLHVHLLPEVVEDSKSGQSNPLE